MFGSELLPRAVIVSSEAEGNRYRGIRIARSDEIAARATLAAYTTPGQYVLIEAPGAQGSGYFAMARAPGSDGHSLAFLVKEQEGLSGELSQLQPGAVIGMSDPIGQGFALDRAARKDVLLLAAGSGIGPIRAAVEAMCHERDRYGSIRLYYGQAEAAEFAFRPWLESLAAHDIEVQLVLSGKDAADGYARGYVQAAADREDNFAAPKRLCVVLCGMAEMQREATERCLARGVAQGQILTNY